MNPETTLVILIGNSEYDAWRNGKEHPDIPNVKKNLELLTELFLGQLISIPDDRQHLVILPDKNRTTILEAVNEALTRAGSKMESLLVYYSGHGIPHPQKGLFLTTSDTKSSSDWINSLSADDLREMIEQSRIKKKLVVLDCCHAEGISGGKMGIGTAGTQFTIEGAHAIFSSAWGTSSTYPETAPEKPTHFTNAFLEAIKQGKKNEKEYLTIDDIFELVENNIQDLIEKEKDPEIPLPVLRKDSKVESFEFCKNASYVAKPTEAEIAWIAAKASGNPEEVARWKKDYWLKASKKERMDWGSYDLEYRKNVLKIEEIKKAYEGIDREVQLSVLRNEFIENDNLFFAEYCENMLASSPLQNENRGSEFDSATGNDRRAAERRQEKGPGKINDVLTVTGSLNESAGRKNWNDENANARAGVKKKIILFVDSNPLGKEYLKPGDEYYVIDKMMKNVESSNRSEFEIDRLNEASFERLKKKILATKPWLIHLCMHTEKGCLAFKGEEKEVEEVTVDMWKEMFKELHENDIKVYGVVLNACNSVNHANAILEYLDFCIATNDFLPNQSAPIFAEEFYNYFFESPDKMKFAFDQGKKRLKKSTSEDVKNSADILELLINPNFLKNHE